MIKYHQQIIIKSGINWAIESKNKKKKQKKNDNKPVYNEKHLKTKIKS